MAQLVDNTQVLERVSASTGSGPPSPKGRKPWQNVSITSLEPDDGLLVTNVNQTQDLMRLKNTAVLFSGLKATDGWIQTFGMENMHLTVEDLLKRGSHAQNASKETEQIEFLKETIREFESDLCAAIELYDKRLQWLLQGSRKMFGVIQGGKVGVLVDVSDISFGPRLCDFKRDLLSLIDEQLCYLKQLYFLSFGTEVSTLWQEPKPISVDVLRKAREWVNELKPSGSCNLLKALKKILPLTQLDTLVIIVGSCPDQSSEILSDYIQQYMPGRKLLIHTVAYECSSQVPPAVLRSIAEVVGGRYHCCSTKDVNYDSSDIHLVRCERQKAEDLLSIVKEIYLGRMSDHLFRLVKSCPAESVARLPIRFLPRPPNHEGPLVIQIPNFLAKPSAEWLKMNGLKAKKLSLYQVLAPNAFSPVEEFVPILQKTVASTLHEKAMMQFEWHDGTVKNIHVDLPKLYDYQKQLGRTVRAYERRIDWLSMASRRIWGTVCERRVAVLMDVSATNTTYIVHLQHSLRLLLEEQMSCKEAFNVIAFGSHVTAWQPGLVPPQPDNLQSVWRWALTLHCEGTRNVMEVLRRAVEVDFKDKDKYESQGLYLLTTGVPDQEMHTVRSYMTEVCGGCDLQLHVCLFGIDSPPLEDNFPPRYASPRETAIMFKEITHAVNGRFHWFGETGIYESDDISVIASEVEKAVNYSHKCAFLVESLKQRPEHHLVPEDQENREKNRPQKLPPPKPTALSLARMIQRDDSGRRGTTKALTWRPTSAKAEIPPAQPIRNTVRTSRKKTEKSKKPPEVSLSLFYTDKGKKIGAIYKKYTYPKHARKTIPSVVLPQAEERCSSKEWLSKFSIKKLKLDLSRLLFGPGCVHQKQRVDSLHKKVSAKYCDIFPSVEMDGIEKHLQVQPKDLEQYIEQLEKVLECYIRRLQWLLSGSRRLFGVILEASVCILIDTSGSMEPSLAEVTRELTSLIWEQLWKNNVRFNLISFADDIKVWQECLVEATDEACHDAVQWASTFQAHGNTSILKALQRAFSLQGVKALYVLSDGKPDTSRSFILQEIEMLLKKRAIKIHTISFNCSDRGANDFLKKLACQTGGRYHRCHGAADGQLAAHKMLTEGFQDQDDPVFPQFEGDDLKKLAEEVAKARNYLKQARFYRLLLEKKNCDQKDCGCPPSPVAEGGKEDYRTSGTTQTGSPYAPHL